MGYGERKNLNSLWNKKRHLNIESNFASPINSTPIATPKVSTPTKDEPMVIEINPGAIFTRFKDFLCRIAFRPSQKLTI